MLDVLIVGAGPAGTVAAVVLARAGARVVLLDRGHGSRVTPCAGLLSPAALAALHALGLHTDQLSGRARVARTSLTVGRTTVTADMGVPAKVVDRGAFDAWLLESALKAGVRFEPNVEVVAPLVDTSGVDPLVRGVVLRQADQTGHVRMPALATIAADGVGSTLATAAGLRRANPLLGRWVWLASLQGDSGEARHEIHGGRHTYIGMIPVGARDRLLSVVTTSGPGVGDPEAMVRSALQSCLSLAGRFGGAPFDVQQTPTALQRAVGPVGIPGLLLAGDAAWQSDPVVGDGLWMAIAGGVAAAEETLRTLASGDFARAPGRLADRRARELGPGLRAAAWIRSLAQSPVAANVLGHVAPGFVRGLLATARGTTVGSARI